MNRTLFIAGPTASGKSSLAIKLARDHNGVIINADSMQVYDGLRIISARPSQNDEADVEHQLYGTIDPSIAYNTVDWVDDAIIHVNHAWDRGKLPIIVGGTGLYFKALLDGMAEIPDIPMAIRTKIRAEIAENGAAAGHKRLSALDPDTAARLKPNDGQRIARALEVQIATGKSITAWHQETKRGPLAALDDAGCIIKILLDWPREHLYERCNMRFDRMLDQGGLEEVRALVGRGLDFNLPAMRALGVPTLAAFLRGEVGFTEAVNNSKQQTRRFAKRQLTFFRNQFSTWKSLNAQQMESMLAIINNKIS